MHERPHAAQSGGESTATGGEHTPADSPSQLLHAESDEVRALLEELDDVVFLAIRGDADSLEQVRKLWPVVIDRIGWELVEESREQYLRYSTDIARRFEHDDVQDPHKALAVIEVIELLMRD